MSANHESSLQGVPGSGSAAIFSSSRAAVLVLHATGCLAAIVLVILAVRLYAYNYQHAWVSGHFAVMARAFNVFGLVDLGLVPVQNNAPLTTSPDAYLHWPPLYPIILAFVFRIFGESVVVHHLSSVALVLGSAALIWRSFADQGDRAAAGLAALIFLSAPLSFRYGVAGIHLHLAILLTVLALFLFAVNTGTAARGAGQRGRRVMLSVGALAYFSAVMTSWEPLLSAPAFCVLALLDRHRQSRLALVLFGCAAIVALLTIMLLYGSEYPHFLERLWNRALMRSGTSIALYPSDHTPHDIQDIAITNPTYPLSQYVWNGILGRLPLLGLLGIFGVAGGLACLRVASALPRPAVAIFLGSFSMFALWSVLMRNHMGIHEYQMLILLPAAACGAGLFFGRFFPDQASEAKDVAGCNENSPRHLVSGAASRRVLACYVAPVLAVVSSYSGVRDTVEGFTPGSEMIALADLAREKLPDNAIIVTPYSDMVFVYYARHHVIRAITSEEVLDHERGALAALCADCPFYLVANKAAADAFPSYEEMIPLAGLSNIGAIWRLGRAFDER
jgi:hypothetical protein